MSPLQFQPLASQPTPAFWSALTTLKLDKLKLDDSPQSVTAWVEQGQAVVGLNSSSPEHADDLVGIQGSVIMSANAFDHFSENSAPDMVPLFGTLKNFNTIEEFRQVEPKKKLFDQMADDMLTSFTTPAPNLTPFLLVTFADLKRYVYHYWFAFPAIVTKFSWELIDDGMRPASERDVSEMKALAAKMRQQQQNDPPPVAFLVKGTPGNRTAARLSDFNRFAEGISSQPLTVVFHDPSSLPNNPGWPLRNILYYLRRTYGVRSISIFCLRRGHASRQGAIELREAENDQGSFDKASFVGWERDKDGKLASRSADLGPVMDPIRLAEQAVDLNLKLMRWRLIPSLELEKIATTKCLLLGAGTLGCYVARALLGWGIRTITFVDSGTVSYSNPVRQPLFDFADCLEGGKPKASRAADNLRRVFPGVNASGHSISIPMPGHPVSDIEQQGVANDVENLHRLIREHDAVFLLMDSRESRWLPAVIGAVENKIVINAALGFDSYLVMRHGGRASFADHRPLGCYFCNDVVAPMDSLTDRSLDQMCTVTRPGLAPIAAGIAVELLTSLLQHPLGVEASADVRPTGNHMLDKPDEGLGSSLGLVPHQIRGNLGQWHTSVLEGVAFQQCTACSHEVVETFRHDGFGTLLKACNEQHYLAKLTGLDKLYERSEEILQDVEWDSEGEHTD